MRPSVFPSALRRRRCKSWVPRSAEPFSLPRHGTASPFSPPGFNPCGCEGRSPHAPCMLGPPPGLEQGNCRRNCRRAAWSVPGALSCVLHWGCCWSGPESAAGQAAVRRAPCVAGPALLSSAAELPSAFEPLAWGICSLQEPSRTATGWVHRQHQLGVFYFISFLSTCQCTALHKSQF